MLWYVVVCCGMLWSVVVRCGMLWSVVVCCGLREILHHFGLSCCHRPNLANTIKGGGDRVLVLGVKLQREGRLF